MVAPRLGRIHRHTLAAGAFLLVVLLLPQRARAQSLTEGALRGEITLADGVSPVSAATLTLEDESGVIVRQFKSDYQGAFSLPQLSPGRYAMLVEKTGYQPTRQRGIDVLADASTRVTVRVARRPPPISKVEELPVADQRFLSSSPRVADDVVRSWTEWWSPRADVSDLGRNSAFVAAPRDQRSGFASSFGGLPQAQSRLTVDGLPGTWLRHPGFETDPATTPAYPGYLFRQVLVVPHATDAEWAGGNGGTMSVISRRAASRFRFEPFAFWSGRLGVASADNAGDSSITSIQAGATASGTLVPDKATYLVGFNYQELEVPTARPWEADSGRFGGAVVPLAATLAAVAQDSFGQNVSRYTVPTLRSTRGGAGGFRLDWRLTQNHTLVARGDFARSRETSPQLGADVLSGAATGLVSRDFSGALAVISTLGDFANEFRFGVRNAERDWRSPQPPATYLVGEGAGIGASPGLPGMFKRTSLDFNESLHYAFGAGGRHGVKVGAFFSSGHWEQDYLYGRDGVFSFGNLDGFGNGAGAFYQVETPNASVRIPLKEAALFGEATFRLTPTLSVLGGLRWDRQILFSKRTTRPVQVDPLFASTFGIPNAGLPDDNNNLGPRIGVVYEGGTPRSWNASLGASRQFGQLNPARFVEAILNDGPTTVRRGVGTFGAWPALPDTLAAPSTGKLITLFSPLDKYKNPRTTKADLSLGRTLGSFTTLYLTAGYHHTDFLLRRTDLNLLPGPTGTAEGGRPVYGTLSQSGGMLVATPGSNRRFTGFDMVSALTSTGFSDNYQVSVGIAREAGVGLSYAASYVWSRTRDNWLQSQTGDPADELSPFPQDKIGKEWVEGRSDYDIPHRAVLLGSWRSAGRVPFTVGARYRFRSGLPFTPGFRPGVDANADGSGRNDPAFLDASVPGLSQVIGQHACLKSQVGQFAGRNSCREAANHALDLSASVGLPVRSLGGRLELMVDVLNVVATATGVVDRAVVLVDPTATVTTDGLGNITLPLVANSRFGTLLSRRTEPRTVRFGLRVAY